MEIQYSCKHASVGSYHIMIHVAGYLRHDTASRKQAWATKSEEIAEPLPCVGGASTGLLLAVRLLELPEGLHHDVEGVCCFSVACVLMRRAWVQ
eukprot:1868695-Rhodomonas_salina.5